VEKYKLFLRKREGLSKGKAAVVNNRFYTEFVSEFGSSEKT